MEAQGIMHTAGQQAGGGQPGGAPASATQAEFTAWVRPHWPSMARLARRLTSPGEWEDALQESLTAAWRKRTQYDPERGTPRTWLLAITADQALKSRRKVVPLPVERGSEQPAADRDRGGDVDLERAVSRLSSRQRLAVSLYHFLGLPVAEVALAMGCSEGTVKSTLADSRQRMRQDLGEDYR